MSLWFKPARSSPALPRYLGCTSAVTPARKVNKFMFSCPLSRKRLREKRNLLPLPERKFKQIKKYRLFLSWATVFVEMLVDVGSPYKLASYFELSGFGGRVVRAGLSSGSESEQAVSLEDDWATLITNKLFESKLLNVLWFQLLLRWDLLLFFVISKNCWTEKTSTLNTVSGTLFTYIWHFKESQFLEKAICGFTVNEDECVKRNVWVWMFLPLPQTWSRG